ncbi:MAG: periplasmic heavy metal sensor [Gammaproteobacteria bacterium]
MNSPARMSVVIIALTLVGAMLGGWAGVRYGLREGRAPQQLDELLHHRLSLSAAQVQHLTALEADFAVRRTQFESQMRAANRDIAGAITVRHAYDAEAQAAVDRLHRAMTELQETTIQHVIAMRALLTPDQVQQFDQTVEQALAAGQP